jgi:hypothetical protein
LSGIEWYICIDESSEQDFNRGSEKSAGVTRFWFSVGVAYEAESEEKLKQGVKDLFVRRFKRIPTELKGARISGELKPGATLRDVASDLKDLVGQQGVRIWVMSAKREKEGHPRDAARALLLERVTGWPRLASLPPRSCIVLLDLSDSHTLSDFSKQVREFHNFFTAKDLPKSIVPAVVAVDSCDWAGIQLADVYAHFGMHYRAKRHKLSGGDLEKAEIFEAILYPTLMRRADGKIEGIGYKAW